MACFNGKHGSRRRRYKLHNPTCSIRRARLNDLAFLPAIELAAARLLAGYAPESVLTETTDLRTFAEAANIGRLWIAASGDQAVGFGLVTMLTEDLPHLEELDVHPSYGRRGLGSALVRTICHWATASRFALLTLTTFRYPPWNYPFYSRLGFTEIPRDAIHPELMAVVSEEAHKGLDPNLRAVMAYRCMQPSSE